MWLTELPQKRLQFEFDETLVSLALLDLSIVPEMQQSASNAFSIENVVRKLWKARMG
jgi:hypothetical protein